MRLLDPERSVAVLSDGSSLRCDLFLGVPVHRVPVVGRESVLAVDGWIPADPHTLKTLFPGVYTVGDVTSVGTPKAGDFSEGQAAIVASHISALMRGTSDAATYDGHGICYLEIGHHEVAKVDFGRTRIQRWFGREWAT